MTVNRLDRGTVTGTLNRTVTRNLDRAFYRAFDDAELHLTAVAVPSDAHEGPGYRAAAGGRPR